MQTKYFEEYWTGFNKIRIRANRKPVLFTGLPVWVGYCEYHGLTSQKTKFMIQSDLVPSRCMYFI